MGLLHYPTCRTQLREPTWSEVGRMHDISQISQTAVFVYLIFLIDEIGQLGNIQLYNLKNPISYSEMNVTAINYQASE